MRIFILVICAWLLSISLMNAQKFIQMDMFGKEKAMRFGVGDELRFKVKGDDKFYVLPIVDLDESTGKIILPKGEVLISDIAEIQVLREDEKRMILGAKLFVFGGSFLAIGIADALLFGSVFTVGGIAVGLTALITGAAYLWRCKKRTFRLNKKRQIRIINLNIENVATIGSLFLRSSFS